MGQRLVMQVFESKESKDPIAVCYYHWDGYTTSTLADIRNWIRAYESLSEGDTLLRVVKAFELMNQDAVKAAKAAIKNTLESGAFDGYPYYPEIDIAGLDEEGLAKMKELYPDVVFAASTNRNCGIISVTKREMVKSLSYAEAVANITLDDRTFVFDAYCPMDKESYRRVFEEEPHFSGYTKFNPDQRFGWDQIDTVIEKMQAPVACDGILYLLIE